MSNIETMGVGLHNAQHRVAILATNVEAFLTEPELLSTVMEELAVVLEEVEQQYEELLTTRRALEEQRQRYQELFDFAPDGYLITNVQGIIQEANQAASYLFRVRQEFLVGKPLVLFVAKPDRCAFHTYLSRLQPEAQQCNWDLHLKPRQGDVFPAMITTSAMRSSQNTLLGWRWLMRDITDLKQPDLKQPDLKQSAVMVRESVTERKLEALRSNFIQTVSHELRTPMTVIVMSMELLKHHAATNEATQQIYLNRVQKAVWRMSALLNDVLLYDEMDTGRRLFSPTRFNLEATCQNVVSKLQSVEGARHTITISSQGACNAVFGDEALVQQMLDRLISNALKYALNDTPVCVTLRCEDEHITITVQDEGIYIPPEAQAQLFEPFYSLTTNTEVSGLGLGLAIVKKAAVLHGGAVTVESSAETGTTFTITLPKRDA